MENDKRFQTFLSSIGNDISATQLRKIKKGLSGHVEKEIIYLLESGHDLMFTLIKLKLLNEKKLAFLRKLLSYAGDGEKLVKQVDEYKISQLQRQNDVDSEDADAQMKTLHMMKNRQFITLGEYQNILENTIVKYSGMKLQRTDLLQSINKAKDKLKDFKEVTEEEWGNVQILREIKNEKENKRKIEISNLDMLRSQKEKANDAFEKIQSDLNRKGKERLNTFDKSLGKKEAMMCEQTLNNLIKNVSHQEECVKQAEKEVDVFSLEKRKQTERVRLSDIKICKKTVKLHERYKKLEEITENILCTMDDIYAEKESLIGIENQIKLTTNDIHCFNNDLSTATDESEDWSRVKAILKKGEPKINYSLFGANSFTIPFDDLKHPVAIEIDKNGDILIADQGNHQLTLITLEGVVKKIIKLDTLSPTDITIDIRNNYAVTGKCEIRVYDGTKLLRKFLPHYSSEGEMPLLVSIAAKNGDELYVLDKANLTIQIFSFDGQFKDAHQLSEYVISPSRIHFLNTAEFLISDDGDHSVKMFHPEHMYICRKFGSEGYGLCEYVSPTGLANDAMGNIIIADSENHRIHVMSKEGKHIAVHGRFGVNKKQFNHPIDVAIHPCGFVIIADANNNRIIVYF